jgi:hypothetical protein
VRRQLRVPVAGGQLSTRRVAFNPLDIPARPDQPLGPPWPARFAVALDASARRRAVWLAFGLTVAPHWGARATNALARGSPRTSARSGTLVARSAAHGGIYDPCTRRRSTPAGPQGRRTATASTRTWKVQVLRAVVTPDFPKKTKCYLYVCQDLVSYI